jgi:NTE family protein
LVFDALFTRNRESDRAVDASHQPTKPTRPTIGLALGGGAARGFAHIGVLRTLVARGIVPDVIVGTSIGAVVGGCYLADQLEAFEEWGRKLTKRGMLRYLDVSFSGAGLISGKALATQLVTALGEQRIEKLPIRFAAIATEFDTGHEIWLTHGRLTDALQASYALPGIFPPVRIGGRWLVDGALVNPVPVSAARALGARVVIAVHLNSDLTGRGTVISNHGSDESDEVTVAEADGSPRRGLTEFLTGGHSMLRQVFGNRERPGIPTLMVEAFNVM